MLKSIITAAVLAASAQTALAEAIVLDAPMNAASLHKGGVDMVVYYMDHADHFEVVATYAYTPETVDPTRLKMAMQDGDDVTFGLPGLPHVFYEFSRNGDDLTVRAAYAEKRVASAN